MRLWAAVSVFFVGAGLASAQVAEFSLSGGVSRFGNSSLGTNVDSAGNASKVAINNGFRLTFRFSLNNYKFMGHEFGYAYNRSGVNLGTGGTVPMSIQQGFYDFLVYAMPEGKRVRPFAAGGVQFTAFSQPGSQYTNNRETKYGINYGGGVKVKVKENWGFRLDVRQYNMGKPFSLPNVSGRLLMWEFSGSVSFLL